MVFSLVRTPLSTKISYKSVTYVYLIPSYIRTSTSLVPYSPIAPKTVVSSNPQILSLLLWRLPSLKGFLNIDAWPSTLILLPFDLCKAVTLTKTHTIVGLQLFSPTDGVQRTPRLLSRATPARPDDAESASINISPILAIPTCTTFTADLEALDRQ